MAYDEQRAQARNKKAQELAKLDKVERDSAVDALLKTRNGRKYLWWLLQIGKVQTQPYTNNALSTAFACGELNVGQQILAHILEVDPAGYVRMMQERADDDRTAEQQLRAAELGDGTDDTGNGA